MRDVALHISETLAQAEGCLPQNSLAPLTFEDTGARSWRPGGGGVGANGLLLQRSGRLGTPCAGDLGLSEASTWSDREEPYLDADRFGDSGQVAGIASDDRGLVLDRSHDDDGIDDVGRA